MNKFDTLCKGCMKKITSENICPHCGYNQDEQQSSPYLRKGKILEQRYSIGKVIEKNNEGIGYIAYDNVSSNPVYIREFFPNGLCYRSSNGYEIIVKNGCEKQFEDCINSFLTYMRAIARLRSLSSIVSLYNIFTENLTAYAVFEWVEGTKLTDFLEKRTNYLSWDAARTLFMPLLSSLSEMNSFGIQHLGICPDNIIITNENKLKLLGFSIPEIRKRGNQIPPNLYDGFSAIEQYISDYQTNESTDVYAFSATLFFALTGHKLQKSVKRKTDDRIFISTVTLKDIPNHVISALANALQVLPANRTTSFEKLRKTLSLSANHIVDDTSALNIWEEENQKKNLKKQNSKSHTLLAIITGTIAFILLVSIGVFWLLGNNLSFSNKPKLSTSSEASSSTVSSSSPQTSKVQVPNFVGMKYETIQSKQYSDFQVLVAEEEFSDSIAQGVVISQTPKHSEPVDKGSTILLTISKGSKIRALPSISGLTLSDASQKVTDAGFKPNQKQDYSDIIPSGTVIGYEKYKSGDKLEYNTEVTIIVSKGKKITSAN